VKCKFCVRQRRVTDGFFFYRLNQVIYSLGVLKNGNENFFFNFLDTKPILSIIFHMWQVKMGSTEIVMSSVRLCAISQPVYNLERAEILNISPLVYASLRDFGSVV
jgi:hypothetical protein